MSITPKVTYPYFFANGRLDLIEDRSQSAVDRDHHAAVIGASGGWYPGDQYVDIIGADTCVDHSNSLVNLYSKTAQVAKKPVCLHENGPSISSMSEKTPGRFVTEKCSQNTAACAVQAAVRCICPHSGVSYPALPTNETICNEFGRFCY